MGVVLLVVVGLGTPAPAQDPDSPFTQDPIGPIVDVTRRWERYQPADRFCVRPNVFEASGADGATATGAHPACRRTGFPSGAKRLYVVSIDTPPLCAGCRRLFLDYSKIPEQNEAPYFYARGHIYFRLQSLNFSYTVDPVAHSPNIKNLTNDKLVAPDGSAQESIAHAFDLHSMAYTGDTRFFAHSAIQGPYYVGPWYLSRDARRIRGAYLDVNVMNAPPLPDPALNEIGYMSGFNNGEATCPDNLSEDFRDGNYFYAGCATWFGGSSTAINPFSDERPEGPRRTARPPGT